MLLILTSNKAVSLQTVAQDIVNVATEGGIKASWLPRQLSPIEVKQQASAEITIMPFDPLSAGPWILLNRDLNKGGVPNIFYATIEGRVNKRFIASWMHEVRYIANSEYTAEKLREVGLPVEAVVLHGVDLKAVEKARSMKSIGIGYLNKYGLDPARNVVVLTIANSHPRKGLAWYDKVVKAVEERDPAIKFLVITEPKGAEYFSEHQNLVVSTEFGKLPRLTVLSLIASAHILAIPSLSEGFGMPALEAMALGTPVVHAQLPPLMEFSTGFTVPVREIHEFDSADVGPSGIIYEQHLYDPAEFADMIIQVVDLYKNKKEAIVDWRAKSLDKAKNLDIRATYADLLKLFGFDARLKIPEISAESKVEFPDPVPEIEKPLLADVVEEPLDPRFDPIDLLEYSEEQFGPGKVTKSFRYPGGDWQIKDVLIDMISRSGKSKLVEVFGGSGVVTMYAPRSQFKILVFNDKDDLVTNFFIVLRDRTEELKQRLITMPFSRELTAKFKNMIASGDIKSVDPVEKAAIFYYLTFSSMWAVIHKSGFAVERSKNLATDFRRKTLALNEIAKRWLDVVIESKDFRDIIKLYDSDDTVFYCDPPFLPNNKKERDTYYIHSFYEKDMQDLLESLAAAKGAFLLKLPGDHLEIGFIKEWIDKNGYRVKLIEKKLQMKKIINEKRPTYVHAFITNYDAG